MAPNSQALKSVRIKNGQIVPFNSFCHPALIAWKWNKIIYGCDCQSVFFLDPRCGEITHFVLIFKSSTRADLGDGRPASATCNTTTGARPITSTCIAQFDHPLQKFLYSALLGSLRSLSLSLYIWSMSCMPLFRPRTKATELAITIAKWTTGTGIHLHDNVVSHLRLHLAGKNLALLVMILVMYILYILFVFTCYICLVAMQAGHKASGRNLRYEHVFLQDCKRESAYRRSADAAKQTQTHSVP